MKRKAIPTEPWAQNWDIAFMFLGLILLIIVSVGVNHFFLQARPDANQLTAQFGKQQQLSEQQMAQLALDTTDWLNRDPSLYNDPERMAHLLKDWYSDRR